jgi:cellulose synthase/poly-beta-1,6-N-acetylglucosamine synthase-like glycosyltransferase
MPERPPVSVIVPFAGDRAAADGLLAVLDGLELGEGDELTVVDNSAGAVVEAGRRASILRAPRIASSYYARNTGAQAARNEWLLFIDSDCVPDAALLDEYFAPAPAETCGLVAGGIEGDPGQDSLVARYHRSRGHLDSGPPLELGPSPAAGTANLLLRRAVWADLGGFAEVVSGADFEFSWRAGAAGWTVEHRPGARVLHRHPETVAAMRVKARRYGAGQRWLDRRYPGVPRPPGLLRELGRGAAGVAAWTLTARFERAAFKALDATWISAYARGWRWGDNLPDLLIPE